MCLFLFVLLLRFDQKLRILPVFYYCNLSTYVNSVATTAIGVQSTLNRLFGCLFSWYDVITSKSKQIIRCTPSDAFSKIVLFLTFLNIQIDLIILQTDDEQFTLTTKISLHVTCKVRSSRSPSEKRSFFSRGCGDICYGCTL